VYNCAQCGTVLQSLSLILGNPPATLEFAAEIRYFLVISWFRIFSLQRGPVDPKFQVEGVAPTNHSSSQKTRLNNISYGIKIGADLSTVLSQFTRLTDGQTDGQTSFSSLYRVCIPCSAVKIWDICWWCQSVFVNRKW